MIYEAAGGLTGSAKYKPGGTGWENPTLDAVVGHTPYSDYFELGGGATAKIIFRKAGFWRLTAQYNIIGADCVSCRILNGTTEECFGASPNDSTSRNNTARCSYIVYLNDGDERIFQRANQVAGVYFHLSAAFSHVEIEYLGV